ncbi:acyltransferase family protein [Microbacterium sp. SLBN-111]|uniref:acyltransferase family protein n=1 Tax=Microbacterium sp. SLBN-111 TaxID=3377733 RepID=UPI003C73DB90
MPIDHPTGSPATASSAGSATIAAGRLPVPDVLRGIAVTAMVLAHAVPLLPTIPYGLRFLLGNVNDVASPLFALVMGMSAQIVWERCEPDGRARVLLRQAIRAAVLIGLGVWMMTWGTWVAIVLGHLGVLLLVGAPLLLLSSRWVSALMLLVWLVSSPLNEWARHTLVWVYSDTTGVAPTIASWLVLGGSYRLTNLLPFFLFGALLLRRPPRGRTLWLLLATAAVAHTVEPVAKRVFGVASYASGSYPDTFRDIALVLAVFVAVSWLSASRGRVRAAAEFAFVPLRALGAVALSLYLLHVALLVWVAPGAVRPMENDYLGWMIIVPAVLLLGIVWHRLIGRAPVEWLIARATAFLRTPSPVRSS